MIKKRLAELLPDFKPYGVDDKLYNTAIEDFNNYFNTIWFNMEGNECRVMEKFLEWLQSNPETAKEEMDAWVSLWLGKWKSRVKLLFGTEAMLNKDAHQVQKIVKEDTVRHYYEGIEYKNRVIAALIKRGEIVCTVVIANYVITKLLAKLNTLDRRKEFLERYEREVKDVSGLTGKTVFLSLKDFNWKVEG